MKILQNVPLAIKIALTVLFLLGISPVVVRAADVTPKVKEESHGIEVMGTFSRVPKSDNAFELRLENVGDDRIAVFRYNSLFDIQLIDGSGAMLSDYAGYMWVADVKNAAEWDWVVLKPGDAISIRLHAFNKYGMMAIPKAARKARCTYYPGITEADYPALDYLTYANIRVVRMGNIPEISLP